jgi:flagellar biosynthesis protein FlhB
VADSSPEERTEAPTPRRIQEARHAGQTAVSRDLVAALATATACIVLVASAHAGVAGLVQAMREAVAGATKSTAITAAAKAGLDIAALTLALPVGALFVVACLAGLVQTLGGASALPLQPDARRVSPSLGRVLGRDRVIEVGKGLIVLCILFTVAFWSIRPAISSIAALGGASAARILRAVGVLGEHLAIRLTVAMLALGAADLLWQRHRHGKALRMSRDEVKREHRESEGEPAQKAERLRRYRELMHERTVGDIAEADFVVVQAGVMAAAIRYDREASNAPVVMVKGVHRHAQVIETRARAAGVPVVVDPDLVRALASVEEGSDIPEGLYQQVAECLVRIQDLGQQAMGQSEN